jgi:hypothetical protein
MSRRADMDAVAEAATQPAARTEADPNVGATTGQEEVLA